MMNWKIWKDTGVTCFKEPPQQVTTKTKGSSGSLTQNSYLNGLDLKI